MDDDYGKTYGIDKLAELLVERGIEFYVTDDASLLFTDASGNPHECWMAGAEENLVNVMIVVTPEQAISVPDLNGVITENAKLRELARWLLTEYRYMRSRPRRVYLGHEKRMRVIEDEMRELGIETDNG